MQRATLVLSLFGVGGGIGTLVAGALGQVLYNRRKELMVLFIALGVLSGECVQRSTWVGEKKSSP